MAGNRDPHRILGVPRGASKAAIKAAYRRLARHYHPDLNSSPDATKRMQDLNWARDTLLDAHRRATWQTRDSRPYTAYTRTRQQRHTSYRPPPRRGPSPNRYRPPHQRAAAATEARPAKKTSRMEAGCSWWAVAFVLIGIINSLGDYSSSGNSSQNAPVLSEDYSTLYFVPSYSELTIETESRQSEIQQFFDDLGKEVTIEIGGTVSWSAAAPHIGKYCPPEGQSLDTATGCMHYYAPETPSFAAVDSPAAEITPDAPSRDHRE